MSNFKEDLRKVKAFVFDVDGVFTDGKIYLFAREEFVRAMNIKDGYAVRYAIGQGYPIGIISGGNSSTVYHRFRKLGVRDLYLNVSDKKEKLEEFYLQYHLDPSSILYMGDDIPDYEVMQQCGIPTCPSDAAEEIKALSRYISDFKGGQGCVRDVIEQVLRLQGKWQ